MSLRNVLFATLLAAGIAMTATPSAVSRVAMMASTMTGGPANLGYVAAVDTIREDRLFYQVRLKLDSGESRTVVQERLNDLRIGDRAEIDNDQVYRHDTRADRIDRWGYWVDPKGHRYDDIGLRVDDGESE